MGNYDYSLWGAVVLNILLFSFFIYAFLRPTKKREWKNAGIAQAFIIALYTEMFGFPLTIFVLNSIFGPRYPVINPFAHESGHLLATFGLGVELAALVCSIASLVMLGGFLLMGAGWYKIHRSQGRLVTDGVYRYMRHPQYTGLMMLIGGMLVQWPTLPTLAMAPILVFAYYRLAEKEENELFEKYGEEYREYRRVTPAFLPFVKLLPLREGGET